ncbi:RNA 2',3'-cyclic phosphodiesterase [Streptomyces sp. NPDC006879]|uniref:RNA 2',3'-cyclic phosphodiesterase n=1 Tax=Streptomyces sp. NPDC006879 TaxID=3364767 RepID=UPI00368A68A3
MRLFVAVLPPPAAIAELGAAVRGLRALPGADDLRWTGRDGWHFTCAFLGEVAEERLPSLDERLARAARRTAPFGLRIQGAGRFSDRVLWAGAAGEPDSLRRLVARVEAAARKAGLALDQHRHYTPHLTLARAAASFDLRPYAEALRDFTGATWLVTEVSLVRSRLPVSGVPGERPRYEVVRTWPLEG